MKSNLVNEYWERQLIDALRTELRFFKSEPDTRTPWQKFTSRLWFKFKWYAGFGWFRAWLHRDCGGDW